MGLYGGQANRPTGSPYFSGSKPAPKPAGTPKTPTPKARPENLGHAIVRMRGQGFNDNAIRGQIKTWHPDWNDAKILNSLNAAQPLRTTLGPKTAGGAFVRATRGSKAFGQAALPTADLQALHRAARNPGVRAIGELTNPLAAIGQAGSATRAVIQHPGVGTGLDAGLSMAGLLPLGRLGRIGELLKTAKPLDEAAAAAKVAKPLPEGADVVRGALKGARNLRGKQEAGYNVERGKRFAAASVHINNQDLSPAERIARAKNELRGELPKINFRGMSELNHESLSSLQEHILNHPHLMESQKLRASDALEGALNGRVPTRGELTLLEHVFGKQTADSLARAGGPGAKDKILSYLNIPRSLMASMDLSAPFRQGLVVATRHPTIFTRNFGKMVKAFGSENVYQAILQDIHSRPTFPMMAEAKLAFTELGKDLGAREERFASDPAEHIPIVGHGIRASGRAYTGFLDKTRADVFDHLIGRAQAQGINVQDPKFLRSLGTYINSATGRGDLGHFNEAAKALNTFFFSPRLLASRLNFLNPAYYARLDPFARKEALRSAIQLAGTMSAVLALASQVKGVKVVSDPRNPDWGKIKIGNTRIDIAGGFQQPLRLFAQLATGTAISSTTGKSMNLTTTGFGKPTRLDLLLRFFEGKESPWASAVTDYLRNSNQVGQKFSLKQEALQHVTPLIMQDATDLYNAKHGGMNGILAAFAGYAVEAPGFGLQTYGPKPPSGGRTPKQHGYFGSSSSSGGSAYFGGSSSSGGSSYFP